MGRKVMFEVAQPVYDAGGNLVGQVGERISEADYDKVAASVAPGTYRPVVVDGDPEPAPGPKPAKDEPKAPAKKG